MRATLFMIWKCYLGNIQHFTKKFFTPIGGVNLKEGFSVAIRVENPYDLTIHFPKMNCLFQIEMEDVHVDMPYPVIPTQQRPGIFVPIVKQKNLAQEFTDTPVISLGLIGS